VLKNFTPIQLLFNWLVKIPLCFWGHPLLEKIRATALPPRISGYAIDCVEAFASNNIL